MSDQGQITPEQVILALDTALAANEQAGAQLRLARSLVSGYAEVATLPGGICKHLRTVDTFESKVCRDCGAELPPDHGVPPGE